MSDKTTPTIQPFSGDAFLDTLITKWNGFISNVREDETNPKNNPTLNRFTRKKSLYTDEHYSGVYEESTYKDDESNEFSNIVYTSHSRMDKALGLSPKSLHVARCASGAQPTQKDIEAAIDAIKRLSIRGNFIHKAVNGFDEFLNTPSITNYYLPKNPLAETCKVASAK